MLLVLNLLTSLAFAHATSWISLCKPELKQRLSFTKVTIQLCIVILWNIGLWRVLYTSWNVNYSCELNLFETYSMPCAVWRATSIRRMVSNLVSLTCRWRYRLLPSHHWVMMAKLGFVIKPMNSRMLTWRVFLWSEGCEWFELGLRWKDYLQC